LTVPLTPVPIEAGRVSSTPVEFCIVILFPDTPTTSFLPLLPELSDPVIIKASVYGLIVPTLSTVNICNPSESTLNSVIDNDIKDGKLLVTLISKLFKYSVAVVKKSPSIASLSSDTRLFINV
jgi:hypothetical protein